MIAIAIGRPKPSAPKIVRANSKTKFASGRTLGSDITLLLGAPRASARPQDERSSSAFGPKPVTTSYWMGWRASMANPRRFPDSKFWTGVFYWRNAGAF